MTVPPQWAAKGSASGSVGDGWLATFRDEKLDALVREALIANPDLRVAAARVEQAAGYAKLAGAALYPQVNIMARGGGKMSGDSSGLEGAGIFASWELDLWGRVRRTVNAAREEAQASAADLATATLSLQAEVAFDYFELRSADAQKKLLDDTVKAYADAVALTRNRFEGGAAPKSDLAQAQTQLDTTRVQDTDVGVQRAAFEHAVDQADDAPPFLHGGQEVAVGGRRRQVEHRRGGCDDAVQRGPGEDDRLHAAAHRRSSFAAARLPWG